MEQFMYELIIEKGLRCSFPNVDCVDNILGLFGNKLQRRAFFFQVEACKEQTANHYDSQSTEQPLNNKFREKLIPTVQLILSVY